MQATANFQKTIDAIDKINGEDPSQEFFEGKEYPKELLYGQRMTSMLFDYFERPTEILQIAARGQHIKRWAIPRSDYPMDRKGYLKWRTQLKLYHAQILEGLMLENGYSEPETKRVATLVTKQKLKTDDESKALEDVICLVFLKYYLEGFMKGHEESKVISILQKTWAKMTDKGHDMALKLTFNDQTKQVITKALG